MTGRCRKVFILQQELLSFEFASECAHCGAPCTVTRHRGRPQKFCSDVCRFARRNAQKRAWARKQSTGPGGKKSVKPTDRTPAGTL